MASIAEQFKIVDICYKYNYSNSQEHRSKLYELLRDIWNIQANHRSYFLNTISTCLQTRVFLLLEEDTSNRF